VKDILFILSSSRCQIIPIQYCSSQRISKANKTNIALWQLWHKIKYWNYIYND